MRKLIRYGALSAVSGLAGWSAGEYLPTPQQREALEMRAAAGPVARAFAVEKKESNLEFAKVWAAKDPHAFLARLLWQPSQPLQQETEMVNAFFTTWVLANPDAAFTAARRLPPEFKREKILPEMLNVMISQNMDTALFRWLNRVRREITNAGSYDNAWIREPLAQLADKISKLPSGDYTCDLTGRFAAHWAAKDLKAAKAWADQLDPSLGGYAMQPVLKAWAAADMPGVLDYLKTEAKSRERQYGASLLLRSFGATDPKGALDWISENLGVPDRNVIREIMASWDGKDASAAIKYVESIENPRFHLETVQALAGGLAQSGFIEDSRKWVLQLPPGLERETGLRCLAYGWTRTAPEESLSFFGSLPGDELTDSLLRNISIPLTRWDPAKGLEWAAGLTNGAANRAVSLIVNDWKNIDPQAAKQAAESLLPGPLREAALKVFQPVPDPSKP